MNKTPQFMEPQFSDLFPYLPCSTIVSISEIGVSLDNGSSCQAIISRIVKYYFFILLGTVKY